MKVCSVIQKIHLCEYNEPTSYHLSFIYRKNIYTTRRSKGIVAIYYGIIFLRNYRFILF